MRKINVSIIGCGSILRSMHLPVLKKLEERYKIINYFDLNAISLKGIKKSASKLNLNTDNSSFTLKIIQLFENPLTDAVFILTPISSHLNYTLQSLKNRKHVFLEKPAALSVIEIDKMIKMSKLNRKHVQVGMVLRHSRWFKELQKIINSRKYGKVLWMHWLETRPFDPNNWRYETKNHNGDAIIHDKAIHQVNLFNSFAGAKAGKVFASAGRYKLKKNRKSKLRAFNSAVLLQGDSNDHLMAIIEYENGVKADLVISYVSEHARESRWVIQLEKAKIITHFETFVDGKNGKKFGRGTSPSCIYLFKDNRKFKIPWKFPVSYAPSENNLVFYDEYKNDPVHPGSTQQLIDFYNSITKNKKPACSLELAREDTAIIEAIVKSVKTRQAVNV